jgi:uncharacterized protein (DUF488 family)
MARQGTVATDGDCARTMWTIGHSTRTLEGFIGLLAAYDIEAIADVRRFPGSRRHPHFQRDELAISLPTHGVAYGAEHA